MAGGINQPAQHGDTASSARPRSVLGQTYLGTSIFKWDFLSYGHQANIILRTCKSPSSSPSHSAGVAPVGTQTHPLLSQWQGDRVEGNRIDGLATYSTDHGRGNGGGTCGDKT